MIDLSAIVSAATKPLWAKLVLALVAIAPIAVGGWLAYQKYHDRQLVETGEIIGTERAVRQGHEQTLDESRKANEARNDIRNDRDNARYDECLRSASAATRGNCVIFQQVR